MTTRNKALHGAGLGLRRALLGPLEDADLSAVAFMEVAPENWINVGGALGRKFAQHAEARPMLLHGLSLSIGGPAPLDEDFLLQVRNFMHQHNAPVYSEHLSYCSDDGHLYDLMPIPFTEEAVNYVATRIARTQDIIGQKIALENVSYYAAPGQEMSELEFINAIISAADCNLLLDVNNIYVNSINHNYDPLEFLAGLPGERIVYGHIAGHYNEAEDLIVDTHGADIIPTVWELLKLAYQKFGVFPTLLERDFNFPPIAELLLEVEQITSIQQTFQADDEVRKSA